PGALVGLVSDAEVVDCIAPRTGFSHDLVGEKLARSTYGKLVVTVAHELAEQTFARAAVAVYGAQCTAHLKPVEREGRLLLAERCVKQLAEALLDVERLKDIADALRGNAGFLPFQEMTEEVIYFSVGVGAEYSYVTCGFQSAAHVAVPLHLAAAAKNASLPAALQIHGKRKIGTRNVAKLEQRVDTALKLPALAFKNDRVDIGSGLANIDHCAEHILVVEGMRRDGGEVTVGVGASSKGSDSHRAEAQNLQCQCHCGLAVSPYDDH